MSKKPELILLPAPEEQPTILLPPQGDDAGESFFVTELLSIARAIVERRHAMIDEQAA